MLDFSTGELIVIGIAAYVFLGPKQVPTVTYYLGKGLGRAVGFINRGRDLIGETVQSQQLQQFYNSDITKGFKTFQKIQSELMSAQINPIETVRCKLYSENAWRGTGRESWLQVQYLISVLSYLDGSRRYLLFLCEPYVL